MNLRSYLRGIGAGLIVASLVFYVGLKINDRKPEEAIDKETLAQSVLEAEKEVTESVDIEDAGVHVIEEGNAVDENGKITESVSERTEAEETDFNSGADNNTPVEAEEEPESEVNGSGKQEALETKGGEEPAISEHINPLPEGEEGFVAGEDTVDITIVRGDSSVSVSRRLFEAGLIESAVEFDQYLCKNGYDKRISVGNYEIPYGLDFEEIAKTIAR